MDARTDPPASEAKAPAASHAKPISTRTRLFAILGGVVVIAAIVYGVFWLIDGSHHVTTDDAYVQADTAAVTPLISGPITDAPVGDTQTVAKGQVLLRIDPSDYQLAVAQAQAALGQAERKVQGYFANSDAQAATTAARGADVDHARAQLSSAQADLARARTDLERRQALAPAGAVSGDELTAAQNRFDQTRDAVAMAQAGVTQAQANRTAAAGQQRIASALVAGTDVADNPEVAAAKAKLAQAQLDLDRTVIRAPVSGVIDKNVAEVGQRVEAGAQLMTVTPIQNAYVNANFKEAQLRGVKLGQSVVLTSDLYGDDVKFHGRVVGVAGGTGSAFAVIPAQNATGNWIKVVQRLPVRIELDPKELARHPLRVGLSMNVDIDIAH